MGLLNGQVALVTGAGRGQGRSHAVGLAREGASVVAVDVAAPVDHVDYPMADRDDLEQTVKLVEHEGARGLAVVADMRDTSQVQSAVDQAMTEFGRIDILVVNHGVINYGRVEDLTDEMWSAVVDTNLNGVFKMMRATIPIMRRARYGRIIVTSSSGARQPHANLSHYVAAKAGVIGLVKSCSQEVIEAGITVNAICPTAVETDLFFNEPTYRLFCPDIENPTVDDFQQRLLQVKPGGVNGVRYLQPEHVTRAVVYLATDIDGVMSGQVTDISLGEMGRVNL